MESPHAGSQDEILQASMLAHRIRSTLAAATGRVKRSKSKNGPITNDE